MSYIIGVDGGGTKTAFLSCQTATGAITRLERPSIAVRDHGLEAFEQIVRDTVSELTGGHLSAVESICLGIPCFGENESLDAQTTALVRKIFAHSAVRCVNDCVVGYAGALNLQPGINIVAGTGAIAYGENAAGQSARSNGWDSEFSDEGSCLWLGRKCLELFCKQADRRLPQMSLYRLVREFFSLRNDIEIIGIYEEQYKGRRREIAKLQKLLYEAAMQGDDSAQGAYRQAAGELALSIEAIRQALDLSEEVAVSYSGGLFKAGGLILKPLKEELTDMYPRYCLKQPQNSPEAGALLMAAGMVKNDLPAIER